MASGSFSRPPLLSHLSPAAARACPDAPLIVAVIYHDAARPAFGDGTMLAIQRDPRSVAGSAAGATGLLPGRSAIAIWDLSNTHAPAAVLVCESAVQCCAFGPGTGGSAVVGGCQDGTLALWDTHTQKPLEHRTYSTAAATQTASTAAATIPVFLPAVTGSASGLASSHAVSVAKDGLPEAEAVVCVEALEPRTLGAGRGGHGHCTGSSVPWSGAAAQGRGFSVLAVSATATVAQWAVTVPGAGAGDGAAGGRLEAGIWDAASATPQSQPYASCAHLVFLVLVSVVKWGGTRPLLRLQGLHIQLALSRERGIWYTPGSNVPVLPDAVQLSM